MYSLKPSRNAEITGTRSPSLYDSPNLLVASPQHSVEDVSLPSSQQSWNGQQLQTTPNGFGTTQWSSNVPPLQDYTNTSMLAGNETSPQFSNTNDTLFPLYCKSGHEAGRTNDVDSKESSEVGTDTIEDASIIPTMSDSYMDEQDIAMKELYSAMYSPRPPPRAHVNLAKNGEPPREFRGQYGIYDGNDKQFQDKEQNRQKMKLLLDYYTNIKGIYDGKRSTSVSPCPAPFVTQTFDAFPKPDDNFDPITQEHPYGNNGIGQQSNNLSRTQNNYFNPNQVNIIAKLYLAFKRADIANDEWPSTNDIRRTILTDSIVQNIFALKKQIVQDSSNSGTQTSNVKNPVFSPSKTRSSQPFENSSIVVETSNSSLSPSANFGYKHSKPVPISSVNEFIKQYCSEFWAQFDCSAWDNSGAYTAESLEQSKKTPPPADETVLQQLYRASKQLFMTAKTQLCDPVSQTSYEWTPASQLKVNALLAKLHNLETNSVVRLSIRSVNSTNIGFTKYAETFAAFVGDHDWKASHCNEAPRQTFQDVQHRLLGPSVGQRLIRDAYLGTNMAQYEISLPGRLTTPRTSRMEGPSCALAPRNRGGLPRRTQFQPLVKNNLLENEEMTESEKLVLRDSENKTVSALKKTLCTMARYRAEVGNLQNKLNSFHEERFANDEPLVTPGRSILETSLEPLNETQIENKLLALELQDSTSNFGSYNHNANEKQDSRSSPYMEDTNRNDYNTYYKTPSNYPMDNIQDEYLDNKHKYALHSPNRMNTYNTPIGRFSSRPIIDPLYDSSNVSPINKIYRQRSTKDLNLTDSPKSSRRLQNYNYLPNSEIEYRNHPTQSPNLVSQHLITTQRNKQLRDYQDQSDHPNQWPRQNFLRDATAENEILQKLHRDRDANRMKSPLLNDPPSKNDQFNLTRSFTMQKLFDDDEWSEASFFR